MQGAFAEHVTALEAAGARTRLVRSREDLDGLDGIVLPGGESTTMTMLMERVGMLAPLRQAIERGLPTLATCAGMIVLAREITDGMVLVACDNPDVSGSLDQRRANEDARECLAVHALDVERSLEAVYLPAVAVAADADVQETEPVLVGHSIGDVAREHDHARAGGEGREAALDRLAQRLEQAGALHQHRHRRALAAREHDSVQALEVLAAAHEPGACPGGLQRLDVLREGSLHREDPDEGWLAGATSLGQRAALPSGWPGSRGHASALRDRPKPQR